MLGSSGAAADGERPPWPKITGSHYAMDRVWGFFNGQGQVWPENVTKHWIGTNDRDGEVVQGLRIRWKLFQTVRSRE
jgi:hypothetical protein